MSSSQSLRCFVIMPFGEKTDTDGKVINFDVIHRYIIEDAVNGLRDSGEFDIDCVRCDDIEEAGSIRADMFQKIMEADVAVVDITALNPNVFYELGVRHALKENVTVLIRRKVSVLPFNIQGLRAIGYDPSDVKSFDAAKTEIQNYIRNGLNKKKIDSPVREVLPDLNVSLPSKPLPAGNSYLYGLTGKPGKVIGLITGDIKKLRGKADVWVNSENTHMQMARYYDRSISGTIRYLGAKKEKGQIKHDSIGIALADELGSGGKIRAVDAASVAVTGSGELARTHRVKKIFHVATVRGSPGGGYMPVPNLDDCVSNALFMADECNAASTKSRKPRKDRLRSILFPIIGTGTAGGDVKKAVGTMIRTAADYFENNESSLNTVYVLTYDQAQLIACTDVLNALTQEGRVIRQEDEESPAPKK